jgi:hypothetical protein
MMIRQSVFEEMNREQLEAERKKWGFWLDHGGYSEAQGERYRERINRIDQLLAGKAANHQASLEEAVQDRQETPGSGDNHAKYEGIKVIPLIALGAIENKLTGAYRIWQLARYIDRHDGSGRVSSGDLRGLLDDLEVHKRTQRRWIAEAVRVGVVIEDKNDGYRYISAGKAGARLGARNIDRAVVLPGGPGELTGKGWRSNVWAAFLGGHNGGNPNPKSQETYETITGVSPRVQRNYNAQIDGIKQRSNWACFGSSGGRLEAVRSDLGLDIFEGRDGKLLQHLPYITTIDSGKAQGWKKGRTRKYREQFKQADLSLVGQVKVWESWARLFYDDLEKAQEARNNATLEGEFVGFICSQIREDSNVYEVI